MGEETRMEELSTVTDGEGSGSGSGGRGAPKVKHRLVTRINRINRNRGGRGGEGNVLFTCLFVSIDWVVFNLQVVSSKQRVKPPSVGTAN